jgi:formate dehydrogenase maturation protein FdhE
MSFTPLTDKEYVEHGGNMCPYCGQEDVVGGSFQFEGASLYQEVSCNICFKDWVDAYKLTGYLE